STSSRQTGGTQAQNQTRGGRGDSGRGAQGGGAQGGGAQGGRAGANAGGAARGGQASGGGPTMVMAGGGGPMMMMMGGPGGFGGNRHKYNLTFSINALKVLNHLNERDFHRNT